MGAPDPLLTASKYGVEMVAVVLGGTGLGWLWEGKGRSFEFSEEINRSRIISSSSDYW